MISVIVPIYNIEDCLERCVRSIVNQTYTDLEIILVDDGSTDNTPQLVDKLAESDVRIKAFHKPNGGSSSARNLGIEKANGEWLGFIDSDDYIEPDMYEKLLNMAERRSLKVVQICRDEVAADGSKLPNVVTPPTAEIEVGADDFLRELLLHKGDCSFCTKLIARECFEVGGFPEGELNEDFRLFTQMLCTVDDKGLRVVDRVGILPDTGYHVYYREGSNTRAVSRDIFPRVFTDIVVNADRIEKMIGAFAQDEEHSLGVYARRFALVQRLDYMLHIPVAQMRKDNSFYMDVVAYLKEHKADIATNPYLNDDQRSKLKMLATAPKLIRQVHLLSMKLRGVA